MANNDSSVPPASLVHQSSSSVLTPEAQRALDHAALWAAAFSRDKRPPKDMVDRAIALGVSMAQINAAVKVKVQEYEEQQRLQRGKWDKEKTKAKEDIGAVLSLIDQSSKVEVNAALNVFDLASMYHLSMPKHKSALIQILLDSLPNQLSRVDQERIKRVLKNIIDDFVPRMKSMSRPGIDTYNEFEDLCKVLCKDHPLYKVNIGRPDIRSYLTEQVAFGSRKGGGNEGLRYFTAYAAARTTTEQFPNLAHVHIFLDAIADILTTSKRATEIRQELHKNYANNLWNAVRLHVNSLSTDQSKEEYVNMTKVCEALVRINPGLKDSCMGYVHTPPPVPVTPSNNLSPNLAALDTFSAIQSAKLRLKSFSRMKSNTKKSVDYTSEMFEVSGKSYQTSHSAYQNAKLEFNMAVKECDDAKSYLTSVKGLASMTNYANLRIASANALKKSMILAEKSTKKTLADAGVHYQKAQKALTEAKSEHSFATKELQEARIYLNELYKRHEVIDVDSESPQKKQRGN